MKLGKLFHLTPLVDDLGAAEYFFDSVFSPLCSMRNYSSHWHRHAAIYIIAETAIEPMEVLPPRAGEEGTSWYRYMERYGPHVHNMAFYVDDADALTERLTAAGVRTTDGGARGSAVFAHPKDTPGMLEFCVKDERVSDPRFSSGWPAFRDDFWPNQQPVGVRRLSHITVVVHDLDAAAKFYVDVLDAIALPDQPATDPGATSHYVLVGEDTVVELTHPTRGPLAEELEQVGQVVTTVTFSIGDIAKARQHMTYHETPLAIDEPQLLATDRAKTWGVEYRFTEDVLVGDPRVSR